MIDKKVKITADYLPNGTAWYAKRISTSNTYKLLRGICSVFLRMDTDKEKLKNELDPATTKDLIERHEKEIGIPDRCFYVESTIEKRRYNVILKMASMGVQRDIDFDNLASKLGITCCTHRDDTNKFTIYFDLPVSLNEGFPISFPYIFGHNTKSIIERLFTSLIPANCEPVFNYILE